MISNQFSDYRGILSWPVSVEAKGGPAVGVVSPVREVAGTAGATVALVRDQLIRRVAVSTR